MSTKVSTGFGWLEDDVTGDPAGVRRHSDGKEFTIPFVETDPVTGGIKESSGNVLLPSRSYRTALMRQPLSVHPSPPTVSVSTAGAATSISGGIRIAPKMVDDSTTVYDVDGDPHFDAVGCPADKLLVYDTDMARTDWITGGEAQTSRWYTTWRFQHTGRYLEIYTRAVLTETKYRLWVSDPVSGRMLPLSDGMASFVSVIGSRYRIIIDFGSVGTRQVAYEPDQPIFGGVVIEPTASIQRTRVKRARFGMLGDSTSTGGSGGGGRGNSVPFHVCQYLDMDHWSIGLGGSGYLAPTKFRDRIDDIVAAKLDYLLVAGGHNDKAAYSLSAIIAEARLLFSELAARAPFTRVIVGGVHMTSDNADANGSALDIALRALATELGLPYISLRDPQNMLASTPAWATGKAYLVGHTVAYNNLVWVCTTSHTSGSWDKTKWRATSFLTGTGKVGATVGDGNADVVMGTDGVHYAPAGLVTQGMWYADKVIRLIN